MFRRRAHARIVLGCGRVRAVSMTAIRRSGGAGVAKSRLLDRSSSSRFISEAKLPVQRFLPCRWVYRASARSADVGSRRAAKDCISFGNLAEVESNTFEIPNVRDFDSTVRNLDSTASDGVISFGKLNLMRAAFGISNLGLYDRTIRVGNSLQRLVRVH